MRKTDLQQIFGRKDIENIIEIDEDLNSFVPHNIPPIDWICPDIYEPFRVNQVLGFNISIS